MKQVLITTTINVPEVLREYRRQGPAVEFIIAGDVGAPHRKIETLCEEIGHARYLGPEEQHDLYPRLSDQIGWKCVQRRNIALLEAAKAKPDIIVTIDDDNKPLGQKYFGQIEQLFTEGCTGPLATGDWFNLGDLAEEPFTYRGWPLSIQPVANLNGEMLAPKRIGVLNGCIFEDPDINATERLERGPIVQSYDNAVKKGVALDPSITWSPINSQNTAWAGELAPLMFVLPEVGRYDDIWGTYIAQCVLRATDYYVVFGYPFVKQDRNPHDLVSDLEHELLGMRYTDALVRHLRAIEVESKESIVQNLTGVLELLQPFDFLPHGFFEKWVGEWR